MKTLVGYFYFDMISKRHEADLYNDSQQGLFELNNWQSHNLVDTHVKYAVGKKAVDELYDYYNEWIKRND